MVRLTSVGATVPHLLATLARSRVATQDMVLVDAQTLAVVEDCTLARACASGVRTVDVALHPRAPWFACWRGAVALPPLLKLGVTASSRNAPFLVHSLTLGHSEPEDETNLRTLRQDETKMFALADKAADATAARLARATAGLCHVALEVAALAGTGESHDAALSEAVFVIPFVSLGLLGEVILLVDGHRTKGTEEMVQSVETSFGQAHEVLKGRFAALEQHAVNALAPLL